MTIKPGNVYHLIMLGITNFFLSTLIWACNVMLVGHAGTEGERLMLIVERNPIHEDMRVIFPIGGVAQDTITVLRVREDHRYWQRAGSVPMCKGTLRWRHSFPHLLDMGSLASAATATSKYYNIYTRQCLWYARVVLAAMGQAFPHCTREASGIWHAWVHVAFKIPKHSVFMLDIGSQAV
ncbi:hypothetical protein EDC04DRAFT_2604129 [Pisolithus marmoratus]|nr:hypothetical protein EDC04DRAFT_2604129 [Pisolithus marmoratus]